PVARRRSSQAERVERWTAHPHRRRRGEGDRGGAGVKHSGAAVLLSIVLLASAGTGDDAPRTRPEALDVLVLTDTAPTLVRWHIPIDGKPFAAAWERYLDQLFADLDRDRDGFLSKAEAMRAPVVAFVESFLQGSLNLEAASQPLPFQQVDTDRDGRISRR